MSDIVKRLRHLQAHFTCPKSENVPGEAADELEAVWQLADRRAEEIARLAALLVVANLVCQAHDYGGGTQRCECDAHALWRQRYGR